MEAVVSKAREDNSRMTVMSGSAIRKNIIERIIKMITVITLETVFIRG